MTKKIVLAAIVATFGLLGALRAGSHVQTAQAPAASSCCDGGACCVPGAACCAGVR